MSDLKLALTYLRTRGLVTALTVFSVALGLGLATIVLLLARQATDTLRAETAYWDLVVGAKGSPLQLVLNTVYCMDAPTGDIETAVWEKLQADPNVAAAVPVSMGDGYLGAPIVGTQPALFEGRLPAGRPLLAQGRMFDAEMEAVVGADIAARNGMTLGQEFAGSHGWGGVGETHAGARYRVVGILAPTGSSLDRAIFTDYRSVWDVHAHGHEEGDAHAQEGEAHGHGITAVLVRLAHPGMRMRYVREVNQDSLAWGGAMAAVPVEEINRVMVGFLAPLQGVLLVVAYLVVLVAALSILISLYLTIHQRRRDLAILRSLGATRGDVFRLIALEAAMLSGLGVICGLVLGHGIPALAAPALLSQFGVALHAWQVQPVEFIIAASVWGLGIVAGLLPAIIAYRLPVADTLVRE